jgi:Zn-dependent peptidase ImmA (M78 family)/transcriptional regulator with XRE-family HTH domain
MKTGTPGFISARLKEGREARGLPAIALADLIGVSRSAVSQYENGEQSPRPEIMEKIAHVLNLPVSYFRYEPKYPETGAIFCRSLSALTKIARTRAERRYDWLREIVGYLREFVVFPTINLPNLNLPRDPTAIRRDEIEEIAAQTRSFWRLGDGPIKNVVTLLETNGIVVANDELGADTLDAFSDAKGMGNTPFVILGTDKAVGVRSRLDAAHELGHLILHPNIDRRRITNKIEHSLIERQAFQFAGAFLFPAKAFGREFYTATLDSLKILKPRWKVSIAMMIKRANDLDFITSEQAQKLWINYGKRGWKIKEPLDDQIQIEQPTLLRLAFEMIINDRLQTRDDVFVRLPYPACDIEALASLSPGLLSDIATRPVEAPVYMLRTRVRKNLKPRKGASNSSAEIFKFPGKP